MDAGGYILRIATEEWVGQVFDLALYYTGLSRKWMKGQTIIFLHKADVGDAFIGYGVIEKVYRKGELSDDEARECEAHGWKNAIEFRYVVKFEKPLPIKQTFLRQSKLRGMYFQGLKVDDDQVRSILDQSKSV